MRKHLRVSVSPWRVTAMVMGTLSPVFAQSAPGPASVNLPSPLLAQACAPGLVFEAPPMPIRVTGGQNSPVQRTYAPGDLITINAGADNGIDVGQQYFTRRAEPIEARPIARNNPATIRTSGWIRIYAVDRQMSLATIVYACDAINVNDYLEPFVLPVVPEPALDRPRAQRANYGRVITGNDNRTSFGKGDFFVLDRGSDHGVTVGAQFVVYRDNLQPGNFLYELGEAVAVNVGPESSTLRVTLSRDAMRSGDYVALRK